jgi:hypothetical protein
MGVDTDPALLPNSAAGSCHMVVRNHSFLGTMWSGDDQGESDRRMMPAASRD